MEITYHTVRETLKNVPPWTKFAEDGMKMAQVTPTHQGLQITLFDQQANTLDCFVSYETIVQGAAMSAPSPESAPEEEVTEAEDQAEAQAIAEAQEKAAKAEEEAAAAAEKTSKGKGKGKGKK